MQHESADFFSDFLCESPGFKANRILYTMVISKGDHNLLVLTTFFFTEFLCVDDLKLAMMWTSLMGEIVFYLGRQLLVIAMVT